jgi:glyoxylase-like metal-dependent hydrolase (beta-lactamase superfamily II)
MKIADGIEMLQIESDLMTGKGFLNPTLIWDENEALLVDTGLPRQTQAFRDAFAKAGVAFDKLKRIVITHSDTDHIGGLSGILLESSLPITVLSHAIEKPYIEGILPPLRLKAMEEQVKTLPEDRRQAMSDLCESFKANYLKLKAHVDVTLDDGEEIPFCGGIIVIFTPGHTPGHISLYHKRSKTLIAADVMNVEDGRLVKAPEFSRLNKELYDESFVKLMNYDIRSVICYHGGLFTEDPNRRIAELAESKKS